MTSSQNENDTGRIRASVSRIYAAAVEADSCCGTTHKGIAVKAAGYTAAELDSLPDEAVVNAFGCGNPLAFSEVGEGEVVLDLGSGAGIDLVLASRLVGPSGRVVGVDMTDAMIAKAREVAREAGCANVTVERGLIEALPVEDASVDWVISNCVINLSPEKERVFAEISRVLKPGGRMRVSDIVAADLPAELRASEPVHASCLGGAISEEDYVAGLLRAGLADVEVPDRIVYDADQLAAMIALAQEGQGGKEVEELRSLAASLAGSVWSARVHARKPIQAPGQEESV